MSSSRPSNAEALPPLVNDEQLAEQLAYYSSRAPEYDDWWHRRGVFDRGAEENAAWSADAEEALTALNSTDLGQDVLELAPGTGTWTVHLAPRAPNLTLVDGSAEMLSHNPVAQREGVTVEIADLFTWTTAQRFDSVVFAFWISHVPRERLTSFFASVASWLRPGGRVFFVDDRELATTEPHVTQSSGQTMVRRLGDGTDATIVKNFFSTTELVAAAKASGIDLTVDQLVEELARLGLRQVVAVEEVVQHDCSRKLASN